MKRLAAVLTAVILLLAGCSGLRRDTEIYTVSREEGSGTRDAFTAAVGLRENGVDMTRSGSAVTNSTAVMLMNIAGNSRAIGYISLASANDSVKILELDGVAPGAEAVLDGSYPLAHPFSAVTSGEPAGAAYDFISFMLSDAGQRETAYCGYVSVSGGEYRPCASGALSISGSASAAPAVERIISAYRRANPGVTVSFQQSDSSSGLYALQSGVCDIAVISRSLTGEEISLGLVRTEFAKDCIAVIVNKSNPLRSISLDQLKGVFGGGISSWSQLG